MTSKKLRCEECQKSTEHTRVTLQKLGTYNNQGLDQFTVVAGGVAGAIVDMVSSLSENLGTGSIIKAYECQECGHIDIH